MTSRLFVWRDRLWRYRLEWLLMSIGITLYVTGIYCLRLTGSWTEESATYTDAQVTGFIFGMVFISISILLMVHVLCEIYWMQYPITCTATIYVSFAILSFFGCIFSFFTFEGYAYFFPSMKFYPILSLVSLTSVALCAVFCIICLLLLTATMKTRGFRLKLYGKSSSASTMDASHSSTDSASDDEGLPLLSTIKNVSELDEDMDDNKTNLNETSSSVMTYNPSSYSSDMKCSQGDKSFACYSLIIIIFFVLCASLPTSYQYFTSDSIFQLDSHGSATYEIFWSFSANYGMNIYPDLLSFYCILFTICTISYLSRKSLWFRIEMRKNKYFIMNPCTGNSVDSNPSKNAFLVKQGEQILYVMIFLFFVLWGVYWIFIYDGYENVQSEYLWLQRVTLGIGKLSMLSFSLCLFPVSKNTNLWNVIFSTSYEHLLVYHKFFAYLFVLLTSLHLVLWLVYFSISGQLWNNIIFASLPYSYSVSNFTVAVMYYWYLFILVPIFIILCHSKIRNFHYEWFYFSHLFGAFVCVSMVVYHANSSWYYIIPPVILYVIDQLVSIYNRSLSIATITRIEQLSQSAFVKFTIALQNTPRKEMLAENYFGKYFLVNIPQISKYEWHPLTVSNMHVNKNTNETEYEFIVSNNGDWTAKICNFTQSSNNNRYAVNDSEVDLSLVGSVVRLDGMYGEPIISDAYRKVLIICDGNGFISYIAFFQHMLHRAIRDESQLSVDLVWICDSPQILVHFAPMLKLYSNKFDADPERLFDVRVFFTNTGISDHDRNDIESKIHLTLEEGSPNLMRELSYIQGLGTFTLILANGSSSLLNETRKIAVNFSAHYREERIRY